MSHPLADVPDVEALLRAIIRAINSLIGKVEQLRIDTPKDLKWTSKGTITAPSASAELARVTGSSLKNLYGYRVDMDEANTAVITYTTGKGSREIKIPMSTAGHIIVLSEKIPLTDQIQSEIVMTIANAGTAGKEYTGALLYGDQ
jgi:hypothetical protein